MKKNKAVGPDELPVEVWKCMGEMGIEFLTKLFNRLLMDERMPEEWRRSVLIPIYKNKGEAQCCGNYREIKLMSHTVKVWKRFIETRLTLILPDFLSHVTSHTGHFDPHIVFCVLR